MNHRLRLLAIPMMLLPLACGGGGSPSAVGANAPTIYMSLSTHTLSESAAYSDPAPPAQLTISLSQRPSSTVYVGIKSSKGVVIGSAIDSQGATPTSAVLDLTLETPSSVGIGTFTDTVAVSVTFDQAGTQPLGNSPQDVAVTYTVTADPPPTISELGPSSALAGASGFFLSITGTHFNSKSVVQWNGSPLTTIFGSDTALYAQVPSSDLSTPGTALVTVSNEASNGVVSLPASFTVQVPTFLITGISPNQVSEGGSDFPLTVNGALFTANSVVQWNGVPLPTAFVSSMQLTAQVPSSDIASAGTASITVVNPPAEGGTSNAATLPIIPPESTAFQINPAHTGSIQFGSVSLPSASAWTITLDGKPSYPLITQGKVFVTVFLSNAKTELIALDQATGAKAWGPVILDGIGNAVYDSGNLFVLYTSSGNPILQAFDAATGAFKWQSTLPDQYELNAAPTAANGTVYATATGFGTTLYAFDESTGHLRWKELIASGDFCSPAVTSSGVYVTYPMIAAAYDPLTGTKLWLDNSGGDGGGGATPVVANDVVFAPTGSGTYNGQTIDAISGAPIGSYIADNPPAIGTTAGYFLQGGTLRGLSLASSRELWSFVGDGALVTSPILINGVVFEGSSSGHLYGIDATTGALLWTQTLGAPIPWGAGWGAGLPLSGMGAGAGLLVVPAGNTLTAFKLN